MIKRKWLMKWLLFIVTISLIFGLMPGMLGADERSPFDMWNGEFIRSNPDSLDAGGEVIINYVKGQKAYMINIQAYGLDPTVTYEAWLMTTSGFIPVSTNHMLLGELTVNEKGFGRLHENGVSLDLDKTKIRVVIYGLPRVSSSWILSTSMSVADGDFQPNGSNRGE